MRPEDDREQMPAVQTPHLLLRAWKAEDLEPYAALCADAEVMRYIVNGATLPHDVAVAQVQRFVAAWADHGFGLWAVEERSSGHFVGFAGLSRPLFLPEVLPAVEVGWRFAKRFWGRGYATESGLAALTYGFDEAGLERIIGIVHEANAASRRVMAKLGMALDRTMEHPAAGVPLRVYALRREYFSAG